MEQIKQIPYGVSDFRSVIEQNLYYVDKSMYIEELERQSRTLIFIRPRRFGKSLFINMMRLYYDKAAAGDFERIFGGLYIGQHPTPLRNHYQVLYLDFSQIGGSISTLEEHFGEYCALSLDDFMRRYRDDYPDDVVKAVFDIKTYSGKLKLIVDNAKSLQIPLYLIIDEYDNFTNVVLNEQGEEVYHAITHADGFYRDLFKKFKGNFERIFLTGVSPVTLDDLTSGFNIGWNASTQPELDKMLGFSTADVRDMFLYYKSVGMLPANCDIEDMIEDMRPWYDNYCFAKQCLGDGNTVFNCDMVLYYLRNYVNYKHSPENMLDPNTKTDYNKLKKLIQLDKLAGDRKRVLRRITEEGERNIQGFFLAYLNLNDYYITAPELELQHGYCDFFLLPNLTHYKSEHSYIIEVKYLPKKDYESRSESQWEEAVQQIKGYSQAPRVEALRQGTTLHRIVMQFCGWDLARMEEV